MKKILKILLLLAITYLAFVGITIEINPALWADGVRFVWVLLSFIVIASSTFLIFSKM